MGAPPPPSTPTSSSTPSNGPTSIPPPPAKSMATNMPAPPSSRAPTSVTSSASSSMGKVAPPPSVSPPVDQLAHVPQRFKDWRSRYLRKCAVWEEALEARKTRVLKAWDSVYAALQPPRTSTPELEADARACLTSFDDSDRWQLAMLEEYENMAYELEQLAANIISPPVSDHKDDDDSHPIPPDDDDPPPPTVNRARVLHDYTGAVDEGELIIKAGEILDIIDNCDEGGWWKAKQSSGAIGLVPSNFLKPIE